MQYSCPNCQTLLKQENLSLLCGDCGKSWDIIDGIPRFIKKPYYWGEIPQDLMSQVNSVAEAKGWKYALETLVKIKNPSLYRYIIDEGRADFIYFNPSKGYERVLDVGSGWGTISCLVAKHFDEVVSLESVTDRINFLKIRAEQDGMGNINPIQANFLDMPIPKSSLDLVILNGVLEWFGIADDSDRPEVIQLRTLKKILDLLKPGGSLYIGIENRYGYNYFLGAKDHSDLPLTSLVPRSMADLIMRLKSQQSRRTNQAAGLYRTYTYSYKGYQSLLKTAGFQDIQVYLVFPDYNTPVYIVPATNNEAFRYMIDKMYSGGSNKKKLLKLGAQIGSRFGLQRWFSPCFSIFAVKS